MEKETATPERATVPDYSGKINEILCNNQFINELNRRIKELETSEVKKHCSLFDIWTAVGLAVIIIQLTLKI